jgi:predicted RNA-binding protein
MPFIAKENWQVLLEGTTVGEPDDTERVTSGSEEGDWKRAALRQRADFLSY